MSKVEPSYLMGIANHLTRYGYIVVTTDDVAQLLKDLEDVYGIEAKELQRGLTGDKHFIVNPDIWEEK